MIIQEVPISKIKASPYNPRKDLKPDDPEYKQIKKSIKEFGMVEPIVWNKRTGNLVGGHQRFKVLTEEKGVDKLNVSVVDLDDKKEQALNVALNKVSGTFDIPRLKELLVSLDDGDFDLSLTGFDELELKDLIDYEGKKGLTEDDEVPPVPVDPITKPGDLYLLGEHRLLCGDSTKREDVERLMDGQLADMVFTDPPYGMKLNADFSSAKSNLKMLKDKGLRGGNRYENVIGDDCAFDPRHIVSMFDYCQEQFWWGGDYYAERIPNKNDGSWIVWDKRLDESADKMYGSCFEMCWSRARHKREIARIKWAGVFGTEHEPSINGKKRVHPTQKPINLVLWFFERWGTSKNLIVDLFGGSGSTLIACEKTKRHCFTMELDPAYCDVIVSRWEKFTGQKAQLNNRSLTQAVA